jgi:osmoprotectant transport system permease protein
MSGFSGVGSFLTTAATWWGPGGLLLHLRDHVIYTAVIVALATLIALPVGLAIGHTGRGVLLIAGVANGLRAVPTLGLAVLMYVVLSPVLPVNHRQVLFLPRGAVPGFVTVLIVLIVLAIPAILTNTYAGIQAVDPAVRDAAYGMGMRGGQVLRSVELPIALPLIVSGLRSATLQVIATVTVAAYLPMLSGLGRIIVDGTQQNLSVGYPKMIGAGLLIAALALVADLALNAVQRLVSVPRTSRPSRGRLETARSAITQGES